MQSFGNMCGLSRAYISILEKGINPTTNKPFAPTIQTLKKIAAVTSTDLDILLHLLDGDQTVKIKSKPIPKIELRSEENKLLNSFRKLNDVGKREAIKRVSELGEIEKYCLIDLDSPGLTIAASGLDENTGISDENAAVIREHLEKLKKNK